MISARRPRRAFHPPAGTRYNGLMSPEQVAELIRAGLPGAEVRVESDDQTHFAARVIANDFANLRGLARHQLVYGTLGARVGQEIHALSIEAYTPEEWARQSR
jgi:acid stress-induced BolA-like protein IbaG/YrbA